MSSERISAIIIRTRRASPRDARRTRRATSASVIASNIGCAYDDEKVAKSSQLATYSFLSSVVNVYSPVLLIASGARVGGCLNVLVVYDVIRSRIGVGDEG